MQSRPNKVHPAIQSDSYVSELREFFADWGLHSGSPSNLAPLAEALSAPGSFREEFTSMTSTVILCEGGTVPRKALLDLLLTAISGFGIERTTEADQWAVETLDTFVEEVIQSLGQRISEDEPRQVKGIAAGAPKPAIVRGPRPVGVPRPASLTPQPLAPLTWNFQSRATPDVLPPSLLEAIPRPKPAPVEKGVIPAQLEAPKVSPPATSPKRPPAQLALVKPLDSVPVKPSVNAPVKSIPTAPVNLPPDHFFRSTMWALSVGLALALLLRHRHPIDATQPEQTASSVAPLSNQPPTTTTPTGASNPSGNGGTIVVGGYSPSVAAMLEARRQAGLEPSIGAPEAGPKVSLPTGMEQVPTFAPATPSGKRTSSQKPAPEPTPPMPDAPVPAPKSQPLAPATSNPSPTPATDSPQPSRRHRAPIAALVPGAPPPVTTPPPAPNKQGAFLVSSGVMSSHLVDAPIPKYPIMASMAGIEGQVILQAIVSRKGNVVATHVLDGHHLLRGAAVNAVKTWHYTPFLVRGKPADITTIVILEFRLPH